MTTQERFLQAIQRAKDYGTGKIPLPKNKKQTKPELFKEAQVALLN